VSHAFAAAGTYTVTLAVRDNNGAQTSNTAVVNVSSTGPSAWVRGLGSTGSDAGYAVAGDAAGNTIVGGTYHGSVTVGATTLTSAGGADWFLAKYSATGCSSGARRGRPRR